MISIKIFFTAFYTQNLHPTNLTNFCLVLGYPKNFPFHPQHQSRTHQLLGSVHAQSAHCYPEIPKCLVCQQTLHSYVLKWIYDQNFHSQSHHFRYLSPSSYLCGTWLLSSQAHGRLVLLSILKFQNIRLLLYIFLLAFKIFNSKFSPEPELCCTNYKLFQWNPDKGATIRLWLR